MTAILILAILLLIAIAGPIFGADTRRSSEWAATDPADQLWSGSGARVAH